MKETFFGGFIFEGDEDEIAMRWMWTLLTDLSWRGKIEVLWRVAMGRPPKWVFKK